MDDQDSSPDLDPLDQRSALTLNMLAKLRDIESVADAALSRLGPQELLVTLVDRVRQALGADATAVLLLDMPSGHLVATAASGLEEEVQQGVRVPVGKGFAGRIAAEDRCVILEEVDHTQSRQPTAARQGHPFAHGRSASVRREGHRRYACRDS